MELTKQALKVDNNQSFPNNNNGQITPTALRTFNENMIDSLVDEITYTADSGSWNQQINALEQFTASASGLNTGSLLITASFDNSTRNMTFTKGDSSTFAVNIPDASGSVLPSGVVSGSSQINYPQISNIPAGIVSGSAQITPLLPSGTVSGSSQVVLQDTTYTDGVLDQFLSTDGAGNLSFDWVKTLHQNIRNRDSVTITRGTPLYVSGSTGDNADVFVADANNPLRRPATLIAFDSTLAPAATGTAIISGEIQNVNTNGFPAGTVIYLAPGGGYTATRPTGSASVQILGVVTLEATNGRGIVFNQVADGLPNIQEGYAWVGNSNGVPVAVTSGSLSNYIFNQNNTFTGTQTFNNISVNGTGSFAYIQSVTGSAKIIGDAFIILNNDTPTERYAGIIVLDSGSAGTSASFQFDGQTNDWFYEYTGSDPLNFGVALFGPEYGTKGSPIYNTNNRIVKGDGGHHIVDSNISDDGSTVSINSATQITGSLLINGNAPLINANLASLNSFTQSIQAEVDNLQSVTGSYATTGSNTFNGDQIVNGNVKQTFNAPATDTQVDIAAVNGANIDGTAYTNVFFGMQDYPGSGDQYKDAFVFDYWTDFNFTTGSEFIVSPKRIGGLMVLSGSSGGVSRTGISQLRDLGGKTFLNQYANLVNIGAVNTITTDQIVIGNDALAFLRLSSLKNEITGSTIISGSGLQVTGSVGITGTLTASLQQGYVWVGDANGRTTTVSTGSFGGGGSAFPFNGNAQISGSLGVTGSMSGFVNTLGVTSQTASVNFNDGNMFVITLPTGSVTHFTPTNIKAGQTINIQISQAASATTGSVTFSPNVLFAGGADYQATATGSAIDLLTLVSLDGTNVLAASIRNFQ
jgi:hypothetical protein